MWRYDKVSSKMFILIGPCGNVKHVFRGRNACANARNVVNRLNKLHGDYVTDRMLNNWVVPERRKTRPQVNHKVTGVLR